jgi:hypothetical protein
MIPGVKQTKQPTREEVEAFREWDANCNTCAFLQREPHTKNAAGFLYGICVNGTGSKTPYPMEGNLIKFHPDDHMGMECWTPRAPK